MRRGGLSSGVALAGLVLALTVNAPAMAEDPWSLRPTNHAPSAIESLELRMRLQEAVVGSGMRGALETAVGRDPSWHAALRDVTAADRDVWAELLKFTPIIAASIETNAYSRSGSTALDFNNHDSYMAISATLPLWTSGGRYYGVKAARSRQDAITYEAMAVRDQATMSLIETWTQAAAAMQDRELAVGAVGRFRRLKSAVVARQQVGFASIFDVTQIDADIAAARQALTSIDGTIEKLTQKLIRTSGQKPTPGSQINRFGRYMKAGKEAFIESAHRNNPQLRAASAQYRSQLYSTRSSRSRFLPSVSLSGEYRHYLNRAAGSSGTEGWRVGVQLKIPLMDLSSVASTAAQEARTDAALYREAATLNAVEMQIDDLWNDYQTTVKMCAEAEREVAARKKSANSTLQRFEKGFGSLEQAISAETDLLSAQRAVLQLAVRETVTAAQLLLVSGKFSPDMLSWK